MTSSFEKFIRELEEAEVLLQNIWDAVKDIASIEALDIENDTPRADDGPVSKVTVLIDRIKIFRDRHPQKFKQARMSLRPEATESLRSASDLLERAGNLFPRGAQTGGNFSSKV